MSFKRITQDEPDGEMQARLIEEHRMLKEAVEHSPVHFCVYDHEDRLLAWNESYEANYPSAFAALRGRAERREVTYADLLRHHFAERLSPDEVEEEVERRVNLQQEADGRPVIRDYGSKTLKVFKYRLPSGAIAGLAVDITDLMERERELVVARKAAEQAARSKTAFLSTMSHEIRTPMNGVLGVTALLEQTELDEAQRRYVELIRSSGEALLGVINEILDFSRIEAGKMEVAAVRMDLRRMLSEIIDLLEPVAQQKGLTIGLRWTDGLPTDWTGDALKIRQCVLNLVGNAIKFTSEGGATIGVAPGVGGVSIEVADTGPGLPPDRMEDAFRAFTQVDDRETRQTEGTGLGLAITRRLVRLMGGEIGVVSRPGEGARFTISLPLAPATAAAA